MPTLTPAAKQQNDQVSTTLFILTAPPYQGVTALDVDVEIPGRGIACRFTVVDSDMFEVRHHGHVQFVDDGKKGLDEFFVPGMECCPLSENELRLATEEATEVLRPIFTRSR